MADKSSSSDVQTKASDALKSLRCVNQGNYKSEAESSTDADGGSFAACNAWILDQVRKSFNKRLATFSDPFTFYAKPLDISPLTCARFGFTNIGENLLKCQHCNAIICAKFHPDLSPLSYKTLARTYREMLANVHSDDCPFKSDAQRWLLHSIPTERHDCESNLEEGDDNEASYFVPPYLYSMSDEFKLFEDKTQSGFIVKKYVRKEARKITMMMSYLERRSRTKISWNACIPQSVIDLVLNVTAESYMGPSNRREEFEESVSTKLKAIVEEKAQNDEGDENRNDNFDGHIRKESALLAAFGWRLDVKFSSDSISYKRELKIKCPICQISLAVPRTDDVQYMTQRANSNVISDTEDQDDDKSYEQPLKRKCIRSPFYFDVINSHRHCCPYASGFASDHWEPPQNNKYEYIDERRRAGWRNVIGALMK